MAWLSAGPVDRGVGEGLTFVASATAARPSKASWILCYRLNCRSKEKVLGPVAPPDVQPARVDRVLTRIVASRAPIRVNDALRYMCRMFRMAVRNHWIERNPAADFVLVDGHRRWAGCTSATA